MLETLSNIYQSLLGLNWAQISLVAKRILIPLTILSLIGTVFSFIKMLKYRTKLTFNYKPKKGMLSSPRTQKLREEWEQIKKESESSPPQSLSLAIIEADNLVDKTLKDLGLKGSHMADRLEQLDSRDIKNLDNLWQAHRVRNDLAQSRGPELNEIDAKIFLEYYEDFLKEVGVL